MKFTNTISFNPCDFEENANNIQSELQEKVSEEWKKFWSKYLMSHRTTNQKIIKGTSYFVDIKHLTDDELEMFIGKKLENIDIDDIENKLSILEGGICIEKDNWLIIQPNCCSDLTNLLDWEDIFKANFREWIQLWIGHPWIFYNKDEQFISFSDYYEKNLSELNNIKVKFKISSEWLQNELYKARLVQEELAIKTERIVHKWKLK